MPNPNLPALLPRERGIPIPDERDREVFFSIYHRNWSEPETHPSSLVWTDYLLWDQSDPNVAQYTMFDPKTRWSIPLLRDELASKWSIAIDSFVKNVFETTRLEITIAVLHRSVQFLNDDVRLLQRGYRDVITRLETMEAQVRAPHLEAPEIINWTDVERAVLSASEDLGWSATVDVNVAERHVTISVPTDQSDTMFDSTISFYEKLASVLEQSIYRSITFDFTVFEP